MLRTRPSIAPTGDLVVVLGAGASRDARLPLVNELSERLNDALITADPARGGADRCAIEARRLVIDYVHRIDPASIVNYELLFEWLLAIRHGTFAPSEVRDRVMHVPEAAARIIARLLKNWSRDGADASYLARLPALADPIDVFTFNFDALVEDECRNASIPCATGFDDAGSWHPSSFHAADHGVRLHKLHGSLSWGDVDGAVVEARDPTRWPKKPVLLLGPEKSPLYEEPRDEVYGLLRDRFRRAMLRAHTCIVMGFGFGWGDRYAALDLEAFTRRGGRLIEVNPTPGAPDSVQYVANYFAIRCGTKEAMEPNGPLWRALYAR